MQNNSNKKGIGVVLAVLALIIVVLIGAMIGNIVKTKDYGKTTGKVLSIETKVDMGYKNNHQKTVYKYAVCEYEVNGERYEYAFRTMVKPLYKVGSEISIAYDASNPSKVRDRFINEIGVLGLAFCALFILILVKGKKS